MDTKQNSNYLLNIAKKKKLNKFVKILELKITLKNKVFVVKKLRAMDAF